MKKVIVLVCMVTVILAAGCGSTKLDSLQRSTAPSSPSMKQQMQNTMDKLNAAMPYIVDWSGYKASYNQADQFRIAAKLVRAYPILKKYLNAEGLFNPADYGKVDNIIDTVDPL